MSRSGGLLGPTRSGSAPLDPPPDDDHQDDEDDEAALRRPQRRRRSRQRADRRYRQRRRRPAAPTRRRHLELGGDTIEDARDCAADTIEGVGNLADDTIDDLGDELGLGDGGDGDRSDRARAPLRRTCFSPKARCLSTLERGDALAFADQAPRG
jgi:hypothetical protein